MLRIYPVAMPEELVACFRQIVGVLVKVSR